MSLTRAGGFQKLPKILNLHSKSLRVHILEAKIWPAFHALWAILGIKIQNLSNFGLIVCNKFLIKIILEETFQKKNNLKRLFMEVKDLRTSSLNIIYTKALNPIKNSKITLRHFCLGNSNSKKFLRH